MCIDQLLVDGRVVALEPQLGFDEGPVGLTGGGRRLGHHRWPGWGNLTGCVIWCAGGHPGGICFDLEFVYAFGIGAYGLAINTGDTFNLAVAGVGRQQGQKGCL